MQGRFLCTSGLASNCFAPCFWLHAANDENQLSTYEENRVIEIEQLRFEYAESGFELRIDRLDVGSSEQVAIVGPSGCGKTTLLHLIAGILSIPDGRIRVNGQDLTKLGDAARRHFRISNIGLVFQEFELIEYLNVTENILLPYRINQSLNLDGSTRERLKTLAASVGITDRLNRNVSKLSQGERQRTAICRALLPNPALILADEPTGNLDPVNKQRIVNLLASQARESNASLVMVTHDHSLLGDFERVIDMSELHSHTAGEEASPLLGSSGE